MTPDEGAEPYHREANPIDPLRPTRYLRSGDYQHRRIAFIAVLLGFVFTGIGIPLAELLGIPQSLRFAFVPAVGVVAAFLIYRIAWSIVDGAGRGIIAFVQPSGNSTPYARTYSAHQALAASGEFTEAFAAYDRTMQQEPMNLEIRRQAAELHMRSGDVRRAESLFIEMRRLSTVSSAEELLATQRLVDLYLGALGSDGRAMVELRRLVERFPNSVESEGARRAIARLKRERSASQRAH